jgi:hypothetical protein
MRKKARILILAAIVAAVVVPVGFALSLESNERAVSAAHAVTPIANAAATVPVVVVSATNLAVPAMPDVPEGAKLLVVGGALFGLAAAVKRHI